MTAYYNEHDPVAAAWLRELINAGAIAPGIVDERSIEDVQPNELTGYTQCHFFAGIGVWSYALRLAGWPDDRPVWTGSCPCQPFSSAGKGGGFDDERHLWPAWQWLIQQCRPAAIFGEQVASKAVEPWIDLVHADLEAMGYAFGCVPFPSAGVGAPHIRDRAYWAAHATGVRLDTVRARDGSNSEGQSGTRSGEPERRPILEPAGDGDAVRVAHPECQRRKMEIFDNGSGTAESRERQASITRMHGAFDGSAAGPTNGLWRNADWLLCRDGKWRPVEPGTFPLVNGAPARVGRLRGYGNAINAQAAAEFVRASRGAVTACHNEIAHLEKGQVIRDDESRDALRAEVERLRAHADRLAEPAP